MLRRALLTLSAGLMLFNCSHELEGEGKATVENSDLTYCGADEQSFVVQGTNLSPMVKDGATDDARVDMPDVCMTRVQDEEGNAVSGEPEVCIPEADVIWVSKTELHFTVRSSLGLTPGVYDVVIRNPDGSQASGTIRITILAEGPLLFWSDPNVVYNGIATQGTIYGSGIGDVSGVTMTNQETGEVLELEYQNVGQRNNRVQVTVPNGTVVGDYDVQVTTSQGCVAPLVGGVSVTDTLDLEVTSIDPRFGWAEETTPVEIRGTDFEPVPRVYLNPVDPSPDTIAPALASIAFVDSGLLNAVVPAGLPPGPYNVVVVNPESRRVGLLANEDDPDAGVFQVTEDPPPVITSISPNYVVNAADQVVTISGSNFRNPEVSLLCQSPDGSETTLTGDIAADGTSSSIDVTLQLAAIERYTVCIVTVLNGDGSYFDFSAIAIANEGYNLGEFQSATDLTTERRAPGVLAQRATATARFLYAMGGDDGAASGALSSVESTTIDIFGEPGEWVRQRESLPAGRTLAGAVNVGRFMYLVGGNDGDAPTTSVLRAQVLDPLDAPKIEDVTAREGADASEGIGGGVWYYRVSAVMDDDDPSNAGGETLPSDPIGVNLPLSLENTLVLTLYWTAVEGAKSYRIYRSPNGSESIDGVRLLAEVDGGDTLSYTDTAVAGGADGDPPLPIGSTGVWMEMPELGTARELLGVAAARDPDDETMFHIYAIGGRDDGGDLASWERLTVTVADDGSQEVGEWVAGDGNISAARSELSAYSVSHIEAFDVQSGTTYIYAGGGTGSTAIDAALVAPGGDLLDPDTMNPGWLALDASMQAGRSGYAGLPGAGRLYGFGGAQGAPAEQNFGCSIDPGALPQIVNCQSESVQLLTPRYLAGSAVESAFIYVVGGEADSGATASVERTVL